MSKSELYLDLLIQALSEPLGLLLETNDSQRLRLALNSARHKAGNPALSDLNIVMVAEGVFGASAGVAICKIEGRAPQRQISADDLLGDIDL